MTDAPRTPTWARARQVSRTHVIAAVALLVASVALVAWAWWAGRDGDDHAFAGGFGLVFTCLVGLATSFYLAADRLVRSGRVRGLWQILLTTLLLLAAAIPLLRRIPLALAVLVVVAVLEVWTVLDAVRGVRRR